MKKIIIVFVFIFASVCICSAASVNGINKVNESNLIDTHNIENGIESVFYVR